MAARRAQTLRGASLQRSACAESPWRSRKRLGTGAVFAWRRATIARPRGGEPNVRGRTSEVLRTRDWWPTRSATIAQCTSPHRRPGTCAMGTCSIRSSGCSSTTDRSREVSCGHTIPYVGNAKATEMSLRGELNLGQLWSRTAGAARVLHWLQHRPRRGRGCHELGRATGSRGGSVGSVSSIAQRRSSTATTSTRACRSSSTS